MVKLLILLLLSSTPVLADNYLHIGMFSYHENRDKEYNEAHKGFGLERNSWVAGYYKNSHYNDTYYVMRNVEAAGITDSVKIGAKIGLLTGYNFSFTYKGVTPALIPTIFINTKPVGIDINIVPTKVYSVQFKFTFGE